MDFQSPIGDSPLHVAVRQGQIEDVRKILIQQQVDVNILNSKQETPLHLACSRNDCPIIQLLVAFGSNPFLEDSNNEDALSRSSIDVNLLINKLLFGHGLRLWIDGPLQADKESPVHTAVRLGKVDDIQRILEGKIIDINDTNANHETPLHLACALAHKHIIHILVSYGADIYKKDIFNNAPIHRAVSQGHNIDTVDYLIIDCACDPNIKGYQGRTLLHFACGTGNAKMVTTLIEKYGISPMATDAVNQTPLHIAASHGQEEVVCLLITRHNLTVDCRSNSKLSPLHLACYCGYVSIVKTLLLTYKADLNALDEFGDTPFLKAALGGNLDLVELMITCFNQDPLSAINDNGDTPLHIACLGGHEELSRLLITKYNCSAYIENKNKETPLDIAHSSDHSSIVRMLISESKANTTQQDHFNDSAIGVTAEDEHVETVQALITERDYSPEATGCADRSLLHEACNLAKMLIFSFDTMSGDDHSCGNTHLHMACRIGHEELARILITKYNYSVDAENDEKKTPLHKACSSGHSSIVRMLVSEFKADATLRDHTNDTALTKAAKGGHVETVWALITELGCSPKVTGYDGRSLLHDACWSGNIKLVEMLIIDFSLDVMSTDDSGNTPLHIACWCGREELARLLITKYNYPVDTKNKEKKTPLHKACSSGHSSIVRMLVSEFKADVTLRDHNNDTAVSKAARGGNVETVHILITELGCSPRITGYDGRSLLHEACKNGSIELAEMLISGFSLYVLSVDDSGNTPLHIACWRGHEELARLLNTKYIYPVDTKNKEKETPLHKACSFGHSSIVRMLVSEFKADATLRDHNNDTAVSKAARGGNVETVHILITELGCSPQITGYDGRSLLHEACKSGSIELAEMLISGFSLDVLSADDSGNTPLHMACLGNHEELARLLITKYNCPVDVVNKVKDTPLHKACFLGHINVVRMFISEFKADKDARNYQNSTPLCVAVLGGHTTIVEALITEFGCSPQVKGYDGRSLLHFACEKGHTKLAMSLIIDLKLDPLSADDSGNTPLHMACWGGHEELARLLITKYNCPVDDMNKNDETPLYKACSSGHLSVVRMLISEFKADKNARNDQRSTPLCVAVLGGYLSIVQVLITEFGCSPQVKVFDGRSLLHYACYKGHTKLALILRTEFKLDPLSADDSDNTPLHMACWGGHEELARLLITKYNCPVDVKNKNKQTPLHRACSFGHSSVVRMLVSEFEADATQRDNNNDTAVSNAAEGAHVETVQALITELGCSPKVTGYNGRSLLHEACWNGSIKLAEMLIKDFSLDVLSADNSGNTPLHMACWGCHEELARLLITKYNSPVDIVNIHKQIPLHIACSRGHLDISQVLVTESMVDGDKRFYNSLDKDNNTPLDLLIKRGGAKAIHVLSTEYGLKPQIRGAESKPLLHQLAAGGFNTIIQELISKFNYDPACPDEDGNTILHIAAQHGQYEIAKFVIINHSNQFPVDHRNCRGLTALHYACMHGHVRIIILIANKALRNKDRKSLIIDECGNTLLHIAALHGQYEVAKLLIAKYSNQCPIDHRNSQGQTALHCACIGGHTRVAKFLVASKADITVRDEDGDTPLKKAFLMGHEVTLLELFDSSLHTINHKLLLQPCERGSVDLINVLLSDFHLDPSSVLDNQGNTAIHIAALHRYEEIVALLVEKYECPIDSRNLNGQTPLHLLCSQLPADNVRALIRKCISEFKADVTIKDNNGDQPIHAAVQAGYTSTVISSLLDNCLTPNSRGFKKRSLLHYALAKGHTSTAKTLIEDFHLSLHCIDEDGNTPLHLSSLFGQPGSVVFLLYEYHVPVYVRNKAGKTALDLATEDFTKEVIREYVKSEHKRIQYEYKELRTISLSKYSGQQVITRVFVLGNPGSGKSTLVESLKRKGIFSSLFTVTEANVPPHTAGIVPSVHQSKETGRLLYYDFAGDQEYYSSHAAILEMVSRSTVGSNVFLVVADLTKDDTIIQDEIGYWLSFISYHGKALDSQCKLKMIIVLSHSDRLSATDSDRKVESARQFLYTHINQSNGVKFDVEFVSSNCCSPRSSRSVASILQQVSKDMPPCSISYEASLLHGLLEKDFGNVVACKFQNLLSSIEESGIYLPSSADALQPIVRELHDIGLLMLIGQSKDELEDYLLLLNPSSLTNEVHEKLFSSSAVKKLESSIGPHFANMGIFPESYLANILPEHITKECLVQLQYCQEFNHAEVGLDYSVTSNDASEYNLLYFPALCKLDNKKSSWSNDSKFTLSIGWYAECMEKFDYFPARFLHVLLLRLAYAFALPTVNRNSTNEVSAYSRRCTMWKNGIHWLMEERVLVECIVEVVNDNKGIVVITKYKENSEEWAAALSKIIDKAMQAKAEFCNAVLLHHFILMSKSNDTTNYSDPENLFDIHDIERVFKQRKKEVMSVGGHNSLDASHLRILRRYSYWVRVSWQDKETQIQPAEFDEQKLDQVLDFENGGVSKHLGQIADAMYEWEGPIAEQLGLTRADVAAIKIKHPGELKLQTREALEQWKQKSGPNATYRNLIYIFNKAAGYQEYVETVYKLFC